MNSVQNHLVSAMLNPGFYDHPVAAVELVETHISRVFLAGEFAYKLKKPVDFGFLDFSTREKRQYFCQEELRLNRRFAPQLYLDVIKIGGHPESPRLGGEPVLEYAVKMKRFDSAQQLDRLQAHGQLRVEQVERFAIHIAQLHRQAQGTTAEQGFGSLDAICAPIQQNFRQIRPLLPAQFHHQLTSLQHWSLDSCARLASEFLQRRAQGFIRECHGDVHLGNMAWCDDQPLLFDCIEFNENLRWIDTINDIAFLVMDLDDRGEQQLGWRFLNRYLVESGDYAGVMLLDFYKVYRALVRAKVACLRLGQADLDSAGQAEALRLARGYLNLASGYIGRRSPQLIISHGLSGSGKTTLINQLAPLCTALSLHSDIERKRLHAQAATQKTQSALAGGIYRPSATEQTYQRLYSLAELLLRAGATVIVDATFIKRKQRSLMQKLAERQGLSFCILDFSLSEEELRRRIVQRQSQPGQISEADCEVLEFQLAQQELLDEAELNWTIRVPSEMSAATVATRLIGAV